MLDVCIQEKRVQELEREVWQYNNDFWTKHNTQFKTGKEEFTRNTLGEGGYVCICIYNQEVIPQVWAS